MIHPSTLLFKLSAWPHFAQVLIEAWKGWVEQAVEVTGTLPPGNAPGETKWQSRKASPLKKEIKLTNAKPVNVPIETLIDGVGI